MCIDADIFFFDKHSRSDGENYLTNGRTYDVTDDGFSAVLNILFLLSGSWESLRHVFLPSPEGAGWGRSMVAVCPSPSSKPTRSI